MVGSSTLGDSTVRENWCLAVPARLVARQVYVPESGSSSLSIVRIVDMVESGRPLWSQDIMGLGLPRASHGRWRDSPGCFFIRLWRARVFLVNMGEAIGSSRDSSGWAGSGQI